MQNEILRNRKCSCITGVRGDKICGKGSRKKILGSTREIFHPCGSPPGVIVADTLSFNAKIGLVDF